MPYSNVGSDPNMENPRQIALVYRKMRISEQGSDVEYWLSQPPGARLAALEEIRREYHGWELGEEQKVERVVTIIRYRNGATSSAEQEQE